VFHQNDTLLGTLIHRLVHEEVFDHDRKQPETRALALLLHHAGLSCRKTSHLVSSLAEPVTRNPISAWYRRAGVMNVCQLRPPPNPAHPTGLDDTSNPKTSSNPACKSSR